MSTITIPLISSQPILAVSPNYILTNECTKKRRRLIVIDNNFKRCSINSSITETIIDAIWYEIEKKFFLLTKQKIFTFDPNKKIIETISDIKSNNKKPFQSFTIINNQSSLLIAYDEWESKFIDRWQQNNETRHWILSERYPLNLNSNEFIGNILAINEGNCLNIAITIYNDLTQEWRLELQDKDMLKCLKKILLPGSNSIHDYEMILLKNHTSNIEGLIYLQANNGIIAIDSKWNMKKLNYQLPIYRMAQFKENNLVVLTTNRIVIHVFV